MKKTMLALVFLLAALLWPVQASADYCATYTVQRGDSLAKIARLCNTTVAAIKQANGLTNDVLQPGQQLVVSGTPTPTDDPAGLLERCRVTVHLARRLTDRELMGLIQAVGVPEGCPYLIVVEEITVRGRRP